MTTAFNLVRSRFIKKNMNTKLTLTWVKAPPPKFWRFRSRQTHEMLWILWLFSYVHGCLNIVVLLLSTLACRCIWFICFLQIVEGLQTSRLPDVFTGTICCARKVCMKCRKQKQPKPLIGQNKLQFGKRKKSSSNVEGKNSKTLYGNDYSSQI